MKKQILIIGVSVAFLLLCIFLILNLNLRTRTGSSGAHAAMLKNIARNASASIRNITTYHVKLERRILNTTDMGKPNSVGETLVCEIWRQYPDKYKEITFIKRYGAPSSWHVVVINGSSYYCEGPSNVEIITNSPPFDSYTSDIDYPYDLQNYLISLAEMGNVEMGIVGDDVVAGRATYVVERRLSRGNAALGNREMLWVDKHTSVCLQQKIFQGDVVISEMKVKSFEPNANMRPDNFAVQHSSSKDSCVIDDGYREISIEMARTLGGFTPIIPAYLPEGYKMVSCGWRDPEASGLPSELPDEKAPLWYKPIYLRFSDGVSDLWICEAQKRDACGAEASLNLNPEGTSTILDVKLPGGRGRPVDAYYEPVKNTISFIHRGIKVRLKGNLTREALVRISESMI